MTSREYKLIDDALLKCREESKAAAKNVPIEVEIRKGSFNIYASDKGNSIIVAVKGTKRTSYKEFEIICNMIKNHYNAQSTQRTVDTKKEGIPKKLDKFELFKIILIDKF